MLENSPLSTIRTLLIATFHSIAMMLLFVLFHLFFRWKKIVGIQLMQLKFRVNLNVILFVFDSTLSAGLVSLFLVVPFFLVFWCLRSYFEKIREFLYWCNLFLALLSETMRMTLALHVTISPICLSVCMYCTCTSI